MTSNIVTQGKKELAVTPGMGPEIILASDPVIPKLMLMQGLSVLVAEGKAKLGDMVRSTTEEKLGDEKTPVDIIPLTFTTQWLMSEKVGSKYEFRGYEPRTAANERQDFKFTKNGVDWSRDKVIDLVALLPQDIKEEAKEMDRAEKEGTMPDLNKTLLPIVIRFKVSSFKAGRDVVTHFTKVAAPEMQRFNPKPYHYMMTLKCHKEKNDSGIFAVFDAVQGQTTPKEFVTKAEGWYARVTARPLVVDESDIDETDDKPATPQTKIRKEF